MQNLLKETLEVLERHNKKESDILFCDLDGQLSFNEFKAMANFYYDDGFGGQEILPIKIVGHNWWLERAEYDGSEWWAYKEMPTLPLYKSTRKSLRYTY